MENVIYKAHEPSSFWKKLISRYYLTLKRWRLVELSVTDNVLHVSTQNGNSLTAPIEDIKVRFEKDDADVFNFQIKCGKDSIRFFLLPYILEDNETEELIAFLQSIPDSGESVESKAGKVLGVIKEILEFFV